MYERNMDEDKIKHIFVNRFCTLKDIKKVNVRILYCKKYL